MDGIELVFQDLTSAAAPCCVCGGENRLNLVLYGYSNQASDCEAAAGMFPSKCPVEPFKNPGGPEITRVVIGACERHEKGLRALASELQRGGFLSAEAVGRTLAA